MHYLTDLFPNTQFIVTAHSPLIVQAAPDANIVLLRRDAGDTIIDNKKESVRGWRTDQLLTSDLFGLEGTRDPETNSLLEARRKILEKSELTPEDHAKLERINSKLEPLRFGESPTDAEAMDLIRRAAAEIKNKG